jgi:hypothetical protein
VKKSIKLDEYKKTYKSKGRDNEPVGMILMRWNERSGTEILTKYPQDINVSTKTLMQIYSTHEYSGDKGFINLTDISLNIASYYSGPESGYYLILLLNIDDDPDLYEAAMVDSLQKLLENMENEVYLSLTPHIFKRLSAFPSLNDEQLIALNYQNDIKHRILEILREDGVVAKSELNIWLKDELKNSFFDIEAILMELMKIELIKQISIKGLSSELVILNKDIFMFRHPPINILKNPSEKGLPKSLSEDYIRDAKEYFLSYRPNEKDNVKIARLIINSQIYETLKLLRTSVVTLDELDKLKKKGVEDVYWVLKELWEADMIRVYQDKSKNEYYALLSDFYIDLVFPKYLLNIIKSAYDQKSKADKVLIEYLKALENSYNDLSKEEKSK